jgi:hypothetical protein
MSCSQVALWWDKDTDHTGRPIRRDVRASAHRVWNCARKTAQTITGDVSHAAELIENTVAQVSRYLDRRRVVVFSRQIDGLLMLSFQRSLRRRVAKLRRLEPLGGVKGLSNRAVDRTWTRQVHAHLEIDRIVRLLSERSRTIPCPALCGLHVDGSSTDAWRVRSCFAQCFLARRSPSEKRTEGR